jgi:protein involved in polysaccharide export with SLBB domain
MTFPLLVDTLGMQRPHSLVVLTCSLVTCIASAGCSVLGFSAYPLAHTITDDTKAVLSESPAMPDIARELSKAVPLTRFLQPGDQLLIEATEEEPTHRIPGDQTVLSDGSVDLGYYGRVIVAGMTQEDAEFAIQKLVFEADQKPISLNVQVIHSIDRFYVVGEVNSPGALEGYETVLDAILKAGGLTNRASACDLLLARPSQPCDCRVTLSVCYRAITQLGDSTTNYHLKPGDRIFVARQSLCEELCGFLIPGKTCKRCDKQQCPCPDSNYVDTDANPFVQSTMQVIASPRPPAFEDGSTDAVERRNDSNQATSAVESFDTGTLGVPQQLPNSTLTPDANWPPIPAPNSGLSLDGELDFGGFLQTAPRTN